MQSCAVEMQLGAEVTLHVPAAATQTETTTASPLQAAQPLVSSSSERLALRLDAITMR
jgi:hypothetical protein